MIPCNLKFELAPASIFFFYRIPNIPHLSQLAARYIGHVINLVFLTGTITIIAHTNCITDPLDAVVCAAVGFQIPNPIRNPPHAFLRLFVFFQKGLMMELNPNSCCTQRRHQPIH